MSKYSIPNQTVEKGQTPTQSIKSLSLPKQRPLISFEFIHGMNGGCLESLYKKQRGQTKDKLKELQIFINEFSTSENIDAAISLYSGKSQKLKNGYTKKIVQQLNKKYPKLAWVDEKELMHIHAKRKGVGPTVYFGFTYENIFNVVYIDPDHDFDK